jgi:hypothetical protein
MNSSSTRPTLEGQGSVPGAAAPCRRLEQQPRWSRSPRRTHQARRARDRSRPERGLGRSDADRFALHRGSCVCRRRCRCLVSSNSLAGRGLPGSTAVLERLRKRGGKSAAEFGARPPASCDTFRAPPRHVSPGFDRLHRRRGTCARCSVVREPLARRALCIVKVARRRGRWICNSSAAGLKGLIAPVPRPRSSSPRRAGPGPSGRTIRTRRASRIPYRRRRVGCDA